MGGIEGREITIGMEYSPQTQRQGWAHNGGGVTSGNGFQLDNDPSNKDQGS